VQDGGFFFTHSKLHTPPSSIMASESGTQDSGECFHIFNSRPYAPPSTITASESGTQGWFALGRMDCDESESVGEQKLRWCLRSSQLPSSESAKSLMSPIMFFRCASVYAGTFGRLNLHSLRSPARALARQFFSRRLDILLQLVVEMSLAAIATLEKSSMTTLRSRSMTRYQISRHGGSIQEKCVKEPMVSDGVQIREQEVGTRTQNR